MSNMFNIAALGIKPTPVTSQRDGMDIKLYASSTVANKPDDDSQLLDIEKTTKEKTEEVIDKPIISKTFIVDARKIHNIDRESIIRSMVSRGIIRVDNKKSPPQSAILEESEIDSIRIPSSETIQTVSQDVQFESPKKSIEKEEEERKSYNQAG